MKDNIEFYKINSFYKGRVIEVLDNGNIIADIPDIILSKPTSTILTENTNTNNIKNAYELNLEKSLQTINGIICKPLYINNRLVKPNLNDTIFILFFNNDPKKVYYINVSNDTPKQSDSKKYNIIESDDSVEVISGCNSIKISEESIELKGNIIVNGEKIGGGDSVPTKKIQED